jgi:DNA repair protein RecN (Recombination protein N)
MLQELRIRNLAIIDRLELTFGPGFNVLTGETGAGKSIIIDAVNLLLGDRASQEIVRAGTDRTEVEGLFLLAPATARRLVPLLAEHSLDNDHGLAQTDELLLAREVRANGRSVARVNGRVVTTALLGEIGSLLIEVHGQGEHFSLLREREHIRLLDRYAGLNDEVAAVSERVRRVRAIRRELESLRQDERERARRIDLLSYQVEEIRAAKLKTGEEEELDAERRKLANAEQLAALSNEAALALSGSEDDTQGAVDALGVAEQALLRLARIDSAAGELAEQLALASALIGDLSREVAHYRDEIEFNPRRLQQVEERLHAIHSLQRKYGDTIDDVLTYATTAAAELNTISHAEERIGELGAEEQRLLREIGRLGGELSAARRAAGERMARAIEIELGDLQMTRSRFAADISWTADPGGAVVLQEDAEKIDMSSGRYAFDGHGLDTVAFLVSANPGEPLRPLAKVASGGETSRLMLALKTVLGRADETPTLIFDEIDQGIGGRVGGTVGRKLWRLSETTPRGTRDDAPGQERSQHQVLCITHLPQLAAYGDRHFRVAKRVTRVENGDRTVTDVHELDEESRIAELAHMMGAESKTGKASVTEMMAEVASVKTGRSAPGYSEE